jgi:hypothetical protein
MSKKEEKINSLQEEFSRIQDENKDLDVSKYLARREDLPDLGEVQIYDYDKDLEESVDSAEEVLDASGFASARVAKMIMDQKRSEAGEVRSLMKAFVLATINTYTPEDLDNFTFSQLAERVALAEKIIEIQQSTYGIEPTQIKLDIIDPEEESMKQQMIAAQHDAKRKEGEARYNDPIAQKLMGSL